MPRLFHPATAVLIICAGTFGPFSGIWAAENPATRGNGPIPDTTALPETGLLGVVLATNLAGKVALAAPANAAAEVGK